MKKTSPLRFPLYALIASGIGTLSLQASTFTWSGGNESNAGWNSGANWVGGTAPTFNNETDLIWHSEDAARLAANQNALVNNSTIRSLTFNENATSNISLRLTNGSGGTAGRTLTFDANDGNASINVNAAATGNITIGAAGPGTGNTIQVALESDLEVNHHGSGLLHLDRIVGGTGAILKNGTGALRLSGSNSYSGGTEISGGTIQANHYSALGTGPASIKTNGTLLIESNVTLANSIQLAGGTLSRSIATGSSYSLGSSGSISSALSGGVPTGVKLLQSSIASEATTLSLSFSATSTAINDTQRISESLSLSGVATGDLYVLELSIGSGVTDQSFLAWLDTTSNSWVNAVDGNTAGGENFVGNVAYNSSYFSLGNYGIDTTTGTVWAVLDHQGQFAVVTIPEPSTVGFLALTAGAALVLNHRRTRRIIRSHND